MSDSVSDAIRRWVGKGLLTEEQARTLHDEAAEWNEASSQRSAQYAVATAAAIVSVVAAGTFLSWAWRSFDESGQALVLVVVAVLLQGLGLRVEGRNRWQPVGYLLQTAGLGILLMAVGHSERAWADGSALAALFGTVALATPVVMIPVTASRNAFMPAVHTAFGYGFLYLFLDRALGMHWEEAIWILDMVMLVSLVLFALRFRRDPHGSAWAVAALVAGLFAGMVLILLTGLGPMDRGDDAVLGLDLWYGLVVGLTLWGIHQPSDDLKRPWYTAVLAWEVLLWIPIGYATTTQVFDLDDAVAAMIQAVGGAIAIGYGLRHNSRAVTYAGCAVLVIAAWVFGIQESGAIGAVLALAFTAALLFWIAGRIGRGSKADAEG